VRVTLARLAALPAVVVAVVVAAPYALGDHPITWRGVRNLALTQVSRLPGHPFAGLADAGDDAFPAPVPLPPSAAGAPPEKFPVRRVARPWHPGTSQLGVQVYWAANGTDPERTVWVKSQRVVDYVTSLGANSVTVSFAFFTPGIQASTMAARRGTPSPRQIEILTHEAVLAGLRVTLRPILDETSLHPPEGWRGSIRPDSVPGWFENYRAFLRPYLVAAQHQQVATFVLGTEFNSMEPHPQWADLVASAHAVFSGDVSYDLNYDNYGRGLYPFGMDGYGVDAYFPVKVPDTAPDAVVGAGMDAFLATVKHTAPRGVVMSEVGIAARRGAYVKPGDFTTWGRYDAHIQPTWYRAACEVARRHRFAGIYFWKVDFDADPAHPAGVHQPTFDFIGRPASEQAIRQCLSSPWSVPARAPAAPAAPAPAPPGRSGTRPARVSATTPRSACGAACRSAPTGRAARGHVPG
jgi:hypothetical protein